jgi:hypothetical protein
VPILTSKVNRSAALFYRSSSNRAHPLYKLRYCRFGNFTGVKGGAPDTKDAAPAQFFLGETNLRRHASPGVQLCHDIGATGMDRNYSKQSPDTSSFINGRTGLGRDEKR